MMRFIRRRLQVGREQGGFTLIELSVAMFITLLAVSALGTVFLTSLRGVALAKQRQAATGLATGQMEQLRALDYGTLSAGLYCGDLGTDPGHISVTGTCGSGSSMATFIPGVQGLSNETLKVQATALPASAVAPLYPHVLTTTLENVTYTTDVYVTQAVGTTQSAFNLTVLVSWTSSVSKGKRTVVQRSVEYSPSRCLSSATHPYAGACQAAYDGDAGQSAASITVIPDAGATTIPGLNGSLLALSLPSFSATLASEQVTKLSGLTATSLVESRDSSGDHSLGATPVSAAADNDPSSASGGTQTGSVSQNTTGGLSLTGLGGTLVMSPSTGDTGGVDARSSSTALSCQDAVNGAAIAATNYPCAWSNIVGSGTAASLSLALPNGAPNFGLASVGSSSVLSRGTVARTATAGQAPCPTTSGLGCVTTQATRSVGTVTLGGLPTARNGDAAPIGWNGSLLSVSGLQESAVAEAGPGHRAPRFTRSGTLTYYDPAVGSTSTVDLSALTSDFNRTLGTTTGTYTQGGHTAVVSISGSLKAGAASPVSPSVTEPDATCKSGPCVYSATPPSTLTATLVYDITLDGAPATHFAVVVNLGSLVARASYKAAFDAP